MTLEPVMVRRSHTPALARPGTAAARTPEWQCTAIVYAPGEAGNREQHSDGFTPQGEGVSAAQALGGGLASGKQGPGVVWPVGRSVSSQPLLCFPGTWRIMSA